MRSSTNPIFAPLVFATLTALAALSLSACGPSKTDAIPTMSVDAIYTAAFHTLTAQHATQLALTPPTSTPSPQPSATITLPPTVAAISPLGTGTAAGGAAQLCDDAAYVKDMTVPDGTVMDPGKNFVKTWEVMNKGTCAWTTTYKLVFLNGDSMGGTSVPVPGGVPSGSVVDLSVSLTAPSNPGDYTGSWQLQNPQGVDFGNVITVVIKVSGGSGSGNTPGTPAATSTP